MSTFRFSWEFSDQDIELFNGIIKGLYHKCSLRDRTTALLPLLEMCSYDWWHMVCYVTSVRGVGSVIHGFEWVERDIDVLVGARRGGGLMWLRATLSKTSNRGRKSRSSSLWKFGWTCGLQLMVEAYGDLARGSMWEASALLPKRIWQSSVAMSQKRGSSSSTHSSLGTGLDTYLQLLMLRHRQFLEFIWQLHY